jgi:phage tail sheath protein FI
MPFQVSPGVNVSEIDLTAIVPAVSSTDGAFAGVFKWGPIEERVLISNEEELVATFGQPNANNFETFFTAANFLSYSNQLYVSRAAENAYNAVAATGSLPSNNALIKGTTDYEATSNTYETAAYANLQFVARYAGALGNSLKVSVCATEEAYKQNVKAYSGANTDLQNANTSVSFSIAVGSNQGLVSVQELTNTTYANLVAADFYSYFNVGDLIEVGNTQTGVQYLQISEITVPVANVAAPDPTSQSTFTITFTDSYKQKANYSSVGYANSAATVLTRHWEYFNLVDGAPGTSNYVATRIANTQVKDELHIVVVDEKGLITGIPGEILEVWSNLSRAKDAKGDQGGTLYYRNVLNTSSRYVWSTREYIAAAQASENFPVSNITTPVAFNFSGGADGETETSISVSKLATAYDQYKSAENIDISLVLAGKARGSIGETLANYLIDNIAEYRRDCVVFVSPEFTDTVNVPGREVDNLIEFRNALRSSSYAVLDSGYKYQYDKYNDIYRWVPLNGDIAGLCVRTDTLRDPWFSPAGFNRGNIKNIVKLSFNPDKADRDALYRAGVNPVVTFPGQGTVLYGDKTLLARPSAFDRINVRRLFIVLEKAIARAAKSTLFEFNDDFTRAAFRNLVEPYLRDIQGRRGIYDFRVVCDATNNTPEVIDRNEFRGDIYIKPARSINFIQLNFVAVRTGVEFEEIVGRF